jgi:hypothetical protein
MHNMIYFGVICKYGGDLPLFAHVTFCNADLRREGGNHVRIRKKIETDHPLAVLQ